MRKIGQGKRFSWPFLFSNFYLHEKTIQEIKGTPLSEREVNEEYCLARHEKRQPNCVYCGAPLKVEHWQDSSFAWEWDDEKKKYVQTMDCNADDDPHCAKCGARNWDFIDGETVVF